MTRHSECIRPIIAIPLTVSSCPSALKCLLCRYGQVLEFLCRCVDPVQGTSGPVSPRVNWPGVKVATYIEFENAAIKHYIFPFL